MTTPREQLDQAVDAYVASQMPAPVTPIPGWVLPIDPDPTARIKAVQTALGVPAGGQFGPLTLTALERKLGLGPASRPAVRIGISVPGGPDKTAAFEQQLGHPVQANREYAATAAEDLTSTLKADHAAGRYSVLSVKPEGGAKGVAVPPSPGFLDRWAGWIADYACDLYGFHEPENDGIKPADFQRWLGEFVDGLRSRLPGHPVRLGGCLMAATALPGSKKNPADYLPDNLEVLAWDGYGSLSNKSGADRSPAQVFDPAVAINRRLKLPMVIAETGAAAGRGKQAQFVRDSLAYIPTISDVLDTWLYYSSGDCTLNADGITEYRKAFA